MEKKIDKGNQPIKAILTCLIVCLTLFFLILGYLFFTNTHKTEAFRSQDIRGSAVQYKGKVYTLNFEQQNHFLSFLNQAKRKKISSNQSKNVHESLQQFILYFFDDSSLIFTPFEKKGMELHAILKNETVAFTLKDSDKFNQFIHSTHDPEFFSLIN